jgi:hypothetical protein
VIVNRVGSIDYPVLPLVAAAIVVSVSAVAYGLVILVPRARAFVRAVRESGGSLAESVERVAVAAESTAERAERVGDTARLDESLERFSMSRARLAVLLAAVQDVRAAAGRLTAVVPRK